MSVPHERDDSQGLIFTLCADPFLNDQNFVLSVLTLEELGATGNKVRRSVKSTA